MAATPARAASSLPWAAPLVAATVVLGTLLSSAVPAAALATQGEPVGHGSGSATPVIALSIITLAVWVLVLVLTKPLIVRWSQLRRFRRELRDVNLVALGWQSPLGDDVHGGEEEPPPDTPRRRR